MEKRENSDINIILMGLDYFYTLEVGKLLSEQLEMYFLDSQGLYEFDIKPKTIDDIVNEFGIEYYRKAQSGTVKYICSFNSSILAIESGVVLNQENMERLDKYGLIVYIRQNQDLLHTLYASEEGLSDTKKQIYHLTKEEIETRDEKLKIASEILVEDNGEPLKCVFDIIKGIKKFYGVEQ